MIRISFPLDQILLVHLPIPFPLSNAVIERSIPPPRPHPCPGRRKRPEEGDREAVGGEDRSGKRTGEGGVERYERQGEWRRKESGDRVRS